MKNTESSLNLYELRKVQSSFPRIKITSSQAAADFCRSFYHEDIGIYESFFLLLLNQQNQTIAYVKISQGGISATIADPRLIAHYSIQALAVGIILCHNHPSGNNKPSDTDRSLTAKIKEGLKLFDITVLDHIILTEDAYYSFLDEGIL
jgi:DNA repair protein RadC